MKGKKIAFEDAGSTSGYLIPLAILARRGIKVERLDSLGDTPGSDSIGYTFSHGELNMVTLVARDLVAAGAYSNLDWDHKKRTPASLKSSLRIFASGMQMVRSLTLVRKNLPDKIKIALRTALMEMNQSKSGRQHLHDYYKISKFTELDQKAKKSLSEIESLLKFLPRSSTP